MKYTLIDRGTGKWCVHDLDIKGPVTDDGAHVGRLIYNGGGSYEFTCDTNAGEATHTFQAANTDDAVEQIMAYMKDRPTRIYDTREEALAALQGRGAGSPEDASDGMVRVPLKALQDVTGMLMQASGMLNVSPESPGDTHTIADAIIQGISHVAVMIGSFVEPHKQDHTIEKTIEILRVKVAMVRQKKEHDEEQAAKGGGLLKKILEQALSSGGNAMTVVTGEDAHTLKKQLDSIGGHSIGAGISAVDLPIGDMLRHFGINPEDELAGNSDEDEKPKGGTH